MCQEARWSPQTVDLRMSYVRNRVITSDSRFEGQLRQKLCDHHKQLIWGSVTSETRWSPQTVDLRVSYFRNQAITTDSIFQVQLHHKPGGHDEHHHSRHAGRDSKSACWKEKQNKNTLVLVSSLSSGVIVRRGKKKKKKAKEKKSTEAEWIPKRQYQAHILHHRPYQDSLMYTFTSIT